MASKSMPVAPGQTKAGSGKASVRTTMSNVFGKGRATGKRTTGKRSGRSR